MIVFCYLGNHVPRYVIENCKNTKVRFPSEIVGMILSSNRCSEELNAAGISTFVYQTTENDLIFSKMNANRLAFRGGFWRYSLERLIALGEVFKEFPQESILHVESDVILFSGSQGFKTNINKPAWLSHKENEDSAAIFYCPNLQLFEDFKEELIHRAFENPGLSEMNLLNTIRLADPSKYQTLSSISFDASNSDYFELNNLDSPVFDPAALGMWLLGDDPHNHFGVSKRYFVGKDFKPNYFDLKFVGNENHWQIQIRPDVVLGALHVHSKNIEAFLDPFTYLMKEVSRKPGLRNKYNFRIGVFADVYREYALRKKRLVFLGLLLRLNWLGRLLKIKS